jgi:hypothetical protein
MQHALATAALLFCFATVTPADIIYDVTVNTSSIAGTAGSLDFNFNPGPLLTQSAKLRIFNFASNGNLVDLPSLIGDVNGSLPGTVTFDNETGFNDYFEGFKFGSTLSFEVMLYGLAVSSPNGFATSGSTFAFSMFSDSLGTIPVLTNNVQDGFATTVDLTLSGVAAVTNFSTETAVAPASPVPEPSSAVPVGTIIALGLLYLRRTQRHIGSPVFPEACEILQKDSLKGKRGDKEVTVGEQ